MEEPFTVALSIGGLLAVLSGLRYNKPVDGIVKSTKLMTDTLDIMAMIAI